MSSTIKSLFIWIVLISLAVFLWEALRGGPQPTEELEFSEFLALVERNQIEEVTIGPRELIGKYKINGEFLVDTAKNEADFHVQYPPYPDLVNTLRSHGVRIKAEPGRENPLLGILLTWLPVLLVAGLWSYFKIRYSVSEQKITSRITSLLDKRKIGSTKPAFTPFIRYFRRKSTTFADIAGVENAKAELAEIIQYLRNPAKIMKLGGRICKGVLLVGPPGTGKTLLARAVAGEANVPFFPISGSEFVEVFMGLGASRVRDLFKAAKKSAPCIIFIDEIDAVGSRRVTGLGLGGNDERDQTLNQLLVEMDGFSSNEGVILIAATNRVNALDRALMRPGRFDRVVVLDRPDIHGRFCILQIQTKKVSLINGLDLQAVAAATPGFSGADLTNLVNEAVLSAVRRDKELVEMTDFEEAINKVRFRIRKKLLLEKPEDRWRVAIHEIGHLSASFCFPCIEEIDSLSLYRLFKPDWFAHQGETALPAIISTNVAFGTLIVLLAGRAAEQVFLGEASSIAEDDIAIATALVHQMVSHWGMSETLGLINNEIVSRQTAQEGRGWPAQSPRPWLGDQCKEYQEVRDTLAKGYDSALKHIYENANQIVDWSVRLFSQETLGAQWINKTRSSYEFRNRIQVGNLHQGEQQRPQETGRSPGVDDGRITVNMKSTDDSEFRDRKLAILHKTRNVLELQATALGLSAPPYILTQLDDIAAEIKKLETEK